MKLKEILEKERIRNCHHVSEYVTFDNNGEECTIFAGCFKIEKSKIISLDGDTYSLEDEYYKYEIYRAKKNAVDGSFKKGARLLRVYCKC